MTEQKKWFEYAGDDSDVIVSTGVHVVRNLANYPFVWRMRAQERKAMLHTILTAVQDDRLSIAGTLSCTSLEELSKTEAVSLAERGLVSPEFIAKREGRALLCNADESLSVVVNGNDHLYLTAMRPGLDLDGAGAAADTLESVLGHAFDFAFDREFGYLTADPANLGSGMHAELTMHLPGLARAGSLSRVAAGLSQLGLSLREGPGAESAAELYRLSNRVTLGISEQEAVFNLKSMAYQVVMQERAARKTLCQSIEVQDKIFRSLGVVQNARLLSLSEFMECFTNVRLGVAEQLIRRGPAMDSMASLMAGAQPATLMLRAGRSMTASERDAARARLVRAAWGNDGKE